VICLVDSVNGRDPVCPVGTWSLSTTAIWANIFIWSWNSRICRTN